MRLVSMLFMLVILYMMIQRARDASMWRWLVNDYEPSAVPVAEIPTAGKAGAATAESVPELYQGPTDLDPEEADAARELFTAISDRSSLSVEEMPTYWRLWRWVRAQTIDQLRSRARSDLSLSHLLEQPDKYRGEIIRLRLHLRRSLSWEIGPEEKAGGAQHVYEAWGWTDESPNFYCIVFTDPPPGMNIGPTQYDEVTFYGYFLKLLSYRDQQDKLRMAPLLIGRVQRHALPPASPEEGPWTLLLLFAGGVILLAILAQWTRSYAFPGAKKEPVDKMAGRAALNKWLSQDSRNQRESWQQNDPDDDSQELDLPDKPTG